MGTQPAKKPTRKRIKNFKRDISPHIKKGDYEKAAVAISKAVRISSGSEYLTGILSAGISSYTSLKKSTTESIDKISRNSVTEIPADIKKHIVASEKNSIRLAVYHALINRDDE